MANLSTADFTTIVRNMVTAVQAGSTTLLNLTVGSVLRAILEAIAAVTLWLQGLVVYVLTLTRFATSKGTDANSWAADYGFTRLAARAATGQVTFTRFTTTGQALVPFGALLQSADGTQTFTVDINSTNPAYNLGLGGYVLTATVATVTVNVTAVNPGTAGNVLANTITSMGQGIPGVDTVTNASAFLDGVDAESDTAFQARFVLFIASLSKGTEVAIEAAIADVQQGLQTTIVPNFDNDGTYDPGFFIVWFDDGSGTPSDGLLASVQSAVASVVALGIRFAVFKPTVVTANVSLTVTSAAGLDHPTVVGNVGVALQNFLNALPLSSGLPYTQLAAVCYGVSGVINVSAILLNSGTSDIAPVNGVVIKSGTVSVA